MTFRPFDRRTRFNLGLIPGLLLTVPLAGCAAMLALYIQPGPLSTLLRYFMARPLIAFLNFLPFWLLMICAEFLIANPFYATAIVGGIGGVLSLVNRTMVEKRDEPLSPRDLALIKEAGNAVRSYDMGLHVPSIVCIFLFILVMVLLGLVFRGRRPFAKRWQNLCLSLAGAAVSFGVLAGCILEVYSSVSLYNSFPVRNRYYITSVYEDLGFPYCFCRNFTTYLAEKPEGFSAAEAASYASQHPTTTGQGKPVNVVMVMNEAFSDVTNFEAFDYPDGEEPLRFFNSLKDSDRAVTGHIVVPNFGAGTANTEFDVITGMQTYMIKESGTSAFRVLNRNIDSIFRVFTSDGYQTGFIHPGQNWFYNRQNVYRYFGAEKLIFDDAFKDAERKGGWITDNAVLDILKTEFESAMEEGRPYFNYTVTIQNHLSYSPTKYGDLPIPEVPLKVDADEQARSLLSVYAEGVRDADHMLEGLTEYFDSREEPVLLVFFGDHLPNLGNSYHSYREIGMDIGEDRGIAATLRTYSAPYVIWANGPAAEMLDMGGAAQALGLPEDNTVNANYLGGMVLELTGREDENSYFSFLNDLRRELPILRNGVGRGGDGEYFDQLPDKYAQSVKKMRFWEYYRLKVE